MAASGGTITAGAAPLRRGARPALVLILTSLIGFLGLAPQDATASPGWAQILNRPTPDFGGIDFVSETEGWLTAGAGLLRTTDGGATWTEAAQLAGNDIDFADTGHGWLVGNDGAIYGTSDGGDTWTTQESGTQVHLTDVVAIGPDEAWAVGDWEGYSDAISYPISTALLHTTDSGATWQRVETPANSWFEILAFVGDAGWAWGQSCADPPPDSESCSGGGLHSVLLRTTDGGGTWELTDVPAPSFASDMVFVDDSNGWIAGTGGIYRTSDGGLTWAPLAAAAGWEVHALAFEDVTRGWAVRQDCCSLDLLSTDDGGDTWSEGPIVEAPLFAADLLVDGTTFYVVGSGFALRSTDRGASWPAMQHPAITLDDYDFVDRQTGLALSQGTLLRSADGGSTWTPIGPVPEGAREIEFATAGIGLAGGCVHSGTGSGCDATVYRTQNGGASWEVSDTRHSNLGHFSGLRLRTATLGWYLTDATTLVLTVDGGATWTPRDMGGFASLDEADVVDGDHMWGIRSAGAEHGRTEHQIWRSTDGGVTWQPTSEPGETYFDLQFADTKHGWFISRDCTAACASALVTTTDGGASWVAGDLAAAFNVEDPVYVQDMLFADARNGWASAQDCDQDTCRAAIWGTSDGGLSWDLESEGEHMSGALAAVDDGTAWLAPDHPMGIGGAPPSRTYLYSTSGAVVAEQPIEFPITGQEVAAEDRVWVPFLAVGVLACVLIAGALAFRSRG